MDAYISMHMCFGNYRARAVGHRTYRPLFPQIGRGGRQQLCLEFASREMAEVELLAELPETMDVAVGLVDVKNTWVEPPDLVAERLRTVLKFVDEERVSVTPDCGFSNGAARRGGQSEGDGGGRRARPEGTEMSCAESPSPHPSSRWGEGDT